MPHTSAIIDNPESAGIAAHPNPLLRSGIAHLLSATMTATVHAAASVEQLLTLVADHQPEWLVCDAQLPGGGIVAVLDAMLALPEGNNVPIVAVVDPEQAGVGPWGFAQAAVSANDDGTELRRAIEIVRLGGSYLDPALGRSFDEMHVEPSIVTPGEHRVLLLLCRGLQSKQIAAELSVSVETVKAHLSAIYRKLDVHSRSAAVAKAHELGLAGTSAMVAEHIAHRLQSRRELPMCLDFPVSVSQLLRSLQRELGFALWTMTRREGDEWILLRTADTYYGVQDGTVLKWSDSYCSRMVEGDGPRSAPSSSDVPAYAMAPIGQNLPIGAYMGVPIASPDGAYYGTLCAMDPQPRQEVGLGDLDTVELYARMLGRLV